jgi:hypothetical protein
MSHPIVKQFVAELRADPQLATLADEFDQAVCAIEHEAVTNRDARTFFKAVRWIVGQDRTNAEKIEALGKLLALPRGPVVIGMRKLTGW